MCERCYLKEAWQRCTRPLVLKLGGGAQPAFRSDENIAAPMQDIVFVAIKNGEIALGAGQWGYGAP